MTGDLRNSYRSILEHGARRIVRSFQTMTTDQALSLVRAELDRAEQKHHAFNSGHGGYAVILEELDELWDAIKADKQYLRYSGSTAHEAVQVAAMAVRFLVNLCDADNVELPFEVSA